MTVKLHAVCAAGLVLGLVVMSDSTGAQTMRMPDGRGGFVERRCEPAVGPKKLPALDALVDSQAVMQHAIAKSFDSAVLSVSFAEDGKLRGVRVLEPAQSPKTDTLAALLTTLARVQASGPLWAVRIRIAGKEKLTVERSLYCGPQRDALGPREKHYVVQVNPGDNVPPGGQRVMAEVSLSELGDVLEVKLIQRSGLRDLDDALVIELQGDRYFPALLDGEAVPSWLRTNGQKLRL